MRKQISTLATVFFAIFILSSAAFTQGVDRESVGVRLSWNDRLVMHTMRSIHSAEMAYQMTVGNGNFATLETLRQNQLIDQALALGTSYGYRFSVTVFHTSTSRMGGFDLTATPTVRRARSLSFYMNQACDIRGAERFGRDAGPEDPVVEACGSSQRTENERLALESIRGIHSAQMTYQATFGAGEFGTLEQLYNANLTANGFSFSSIYRGYVVHSLIITPGTPTTPPGFSFTVVPQQYERSGTRSFYVDETGVIRGADKNGAPADPSDPPISR